MNNEDIYVHGVMQELVGARRRTWNHLLCGRQSNAVFYFGRRPRLSRVLRRVLPRTVSNIRSMLAALISRREQILIAEQDPEFWKSTTHRGVVIDDQAADQNWADSSGIDNKPTSWYVNVKQEDDMPTTARKPDARAKLLDAALTLIRTKGYSATTVDKLCAAAGVTKGAFFHHFKSKDELGVAAADHWSETTGAMFAKARYHDHADPLQRVLGYLEFRKSLLQGGVPEFTCLVGTMVQETYETAPAIRAACDRSISDHAEKLEADFKAAINERGLTPEWTAKSLALHTQVVLQGAFILAKAKGGADIAAESVDHLIRYLELLFAVGTFGKSRSRIEAIKRDD